VQDAVVESIARHGLFRLLVPALLSMRPDLQSLETIFRILADMAKRDTHLIAQLVRSGSLVLVFDFLFSSSSSPSSSSSSADSSSSLSPGDGSSGTDRVQRRYAREAAVSLLITMANDSTFGRDMADYLCDWLTGAFRPFLTTKVTPFFLPPHHIDNNTWTNSSFSLAITTPSLLPFPPSLLPLF